MSRMQPAKISPSKLVLCSEILLVLDHCIVHYANCLGLYNRMFSDVTSQKSKGFGSFVLSVYHNLRAFVILALCYENEGHYLKLLSFVANNL